jgi:hypothetical protein
MDLEALSPKVPSIEFVFRYANVFPRALALMGLRQIRPETIDQPDIRIAREYRRVQLCAQIANAA